MLLWLSISKDVIPAKAGIHEQEFFAPVKCKVGLCIYTVYLRVFEQKWHALHSGLLVYP